MSRRGGASVKWGPRGAGGSEQSAPSRPAARRGGWIDPRRRARDKQPPRARSDNWANSFAKSSSGEGLRAHNSFQGGRRQPACRRALPPDQVGAGEAAESTGGQQQVARARRATRPRKPLSSPSLGARRSALGSGRAESSRQAAQQVVGGGKQQVDNYYSFSRSAPADLNGNLFAGSGKWSAGGGGTRMMSSGKIEEAAAESYENY